MVFGEISGKKKGGIAIQFDVIEKFLWRNVKIDLNRSERRREEKLRSVEKRRAKKHVGDI